MNRLHEFLDDEARFDRLVDGELSPVDYKTLLASLDDEPGGWRRLALAFLEAQALGGELATIRRGMDDLSMNPRTESGGGFTRKRPVMARWPREAKWLALAACWLVMFGLGVAFDRGLVGGWTPSQAPGPTLVQHDNAGPAVRHVVDKPDHSLAASYGGLDPDEPVGNLNLVLEGADESEMPMVVPVYRADARSANGFANSSAMSPEVLRALERHGHAVRRQQEFVPLVLENGERAVVPVEKFEIVPVSYRPY